MEKAFVTLLTSDSYIQGAIALAHSLRLTKTRYSLVCMATTDVSNTLLSELYKPNVLFDEIIQVDTLNSHDNENLGLLGRPELGITFTKINVWNLIQYQYVVFLDADTVVLKNIDGLFDQAHEMDIQNKNNSRKVFAAAPDVGWPDHFNSGVFLCKPDKELFDSLVEFANTKGSFDGGDQGLLNRYFKDWLNIPNGRLSFTYNVTPSAYYSYAPAYKENMDNIKVIHFIGNNKPWWSSPSTSTSSIKDKRSTTDESSDQFQCLVNKWWNVFTDYSQTTNTDFQGNTTSSGMDQSTNQENNNFFISNHPYDNAWKTKTIQDPNIPQNSEHKATEKEENTHETTCNVENTPQNSENLPVKETIKEKEISVVPEFSHPIDFAWKTNKIITPEEKEKREKALAKLTENYHPTDNAWKTKTILTKDELLENESELEKVISQQMVVEEEVKEEEKHEMEQPWDPAVIAASIAKKNKEREEEEETKDIRVVENKIEKKNTTTLESTEKVHVEGSTNQHNTNNKEVSPVSEIENFSHYRIDWNMNDLRGFKRHVKNMLNKRKTSNDDIKTIEQLPGVHVTELFNDEESSKGDENDENENNYYSVNEEKYYKEANTSRRSGHGSVMAEENEKRRESIEISEKVNLDNYDVYGFNYQNQLRRKSISKDTSFSSSGGKRRKSIVEVLNSFDMHPLTPLNNQSFSHQDEEMEEPIDITGIIENNFEEDLFIDEDEIGNLSFVRRHSVVTDMSNSIILNKDDGENDDEILDDGDLEEEIILNVGLSDNEDEEEVKSPEKEIIMKNNDNLGLSEINETKISNSESNDENTTTKSLSHDEMKEEEIIILKEEEKEEVLEIKENMTSPIVEIKKVIKEKSVNSDKSKKDDVNDIIFQKENISEDDGYFAEEIEERKKDNTFSPISKEKVDNYIDLDINHKEIKEEAQVVDVMANVSENINVEKVAEAAEKEYIELESKSETIEKVKTTNKVATVAEVTSLLLEKEKKTTTTLEIKEENKKKELYVQNGQEKKIKTSSETKKEEEEFKVEKHENEEPLVEMESIILTGNHDITEDKVHNVVFKDEKTTTTKKNEIKNEDSTLVQDASNDNEKSEIIEEEKSEEIIVIPRKRRSRKISKRTSSSSDKKGMYAKIPCLTDDENVVLDTIRLFGRQTDLLSKFEESTYSYFMNTINAEQYHEQYLNIVAELCQANSNDVRYSSMTTTFMSQSTENLWGSIANGFLNETREEKKKEHSGEEDEEDKTLIETNDNTNKRKSHRFSFLKFGSKKRNSTHESKLRKNNRHSTSYNRRSSYYNTMNEQKIHEDNKHQKDMLNEWCHNHQKKLEEKLNPNNKGKEENLKPATTKITIQTENINSDTTKVSIAVESITATTAINIVKKEEGIEENVENKTTITSNETVIKNETNNKECSVEEKTTTSTTNVSTNNDIIKQENTKINTEENVSKTESKETTTNITKSNTIEKKKKKKWWKRK